MNRYFVIATVFFFLSAGFVAREAGLAQETQPQKTVLSVLAPLGLLDAGLVREFESRKQVSVRVELVGSVHEYEPRLRGSPRVWDVVVSDESQLIRLVLARLTRPITETLAVPKAESKLPLEHRSKINEDGRSYVLLMADPLGLVWKGETRTAKSPLAWVQLANLTDNPLWRSRTLLPSDVRVQFLLALKASGSASAANLTISELRPAFDWLKAARQQSRLKSFQPEIDFLANRIVAGAVWRSDFLRMRRLIPNLTFGVPKAGTYFSRFGAAVVADSAQENLANEFVRFLLEKRETLASFTQLVSLTAAAVDESSVASWTLLEDELVLPRAVENELAKVIGTE